MYFADIASVLSTRLKSEERRIDFLLPAVYNVHHCHRKWSKLDRNLKLKVSTHFIDDCQWVTEPHQGGLDSSKPPSLPIRLYEQGGPGRHWVVLLITFSFPSPASVLQPPRLLSSISVASPWQSVWDDPQIIVIWSRQCRMRREKIDRVKERGADREVRI